MAILPVAHFFFERVAIVDGAVKARNEGYYMSNLARDRLCIPTAKPKRYRPFIAHYWLVAMTAVLASIIAIVLIATTDLL